MRKKNKKQSLINNILFFKNNNQTLQTKSIPFLNKTKKKLIKFKNKVKI